MAMTNRGRGWPTAAVVGGGSGPAFPLLAVNVIDVKRRLETIYQSQTFNSVDRDGWMEWEKRLEWLKSESEVSFSFLWYAPSW